MGRRTGTESALALVVAFIKRKNWKQSDLARELGIGVPALRKKLTELQSAGMPLEKCDEPPNVYWRLPRSWLPEAVQLDATEVGELLRLLARLPNSATRNRLVDRVVQGRPRSSVQPGVVVAPAQDQQEEQWLSFVEDAARRGEVLAFRYYTATRGVMESREATPHAVLVDSPARFIATCHRSGTLKWFRVDRMHGARLAGSGNARKVDPAIVAEALRTSINGYRDGAQATEARFFVSEPDSRWVATNLPAPLSAQPVAGGIRVTGHTAALVQVARFVASLGVAARAESAELRAMCLELARGSLHANTEATEHLARAN